MEKQYKALSGGGLSIASIAIMLGYLNNAFALGLPPEVIQGIAGFMKDNLKEVK